MIFLNSDSSAAAVLVFDLPLCTHTDTRGETERGQSTEYILKSSKKNTLFNEHPVALSFPSNQEQAEASTSAPIGARKWNFRPFLGNYAGLTDRPTIQLTDSSTHRVVIIAIIAWRVFLTPSLSFFWLVETMY